MTAKKAAATPESKNLRKEIDELKKQHEKELKAQQKAHEEALAEVTAQAETTAKPTDPNPVAGEMLTPNVIAPDHPEVPHYESGYAVERSFYPGHELPAHARPLDLDPRTNGPFLDEVRAVEAANRENMRTEHVKALAQSAGVQ